MSVDNLRDQLRRDEGVRTKVYFDSLGIPTIGVGRNLRDTGLSDAEVNLLLDNDIADRAAAMARYPWFNDLDPVRQGAILNMAFNMGVGRVLAFNHMIVELARQNWVGAAAEMRNSLWAKQVGPRAERLCQQILTGQWV
jgi:lysozyme